MLKKTLNTLIAAFMVASANATSGDAVNATIQFCWSEDFGYSQLGDTTPIQFTRFQLEVALSPGGQLILDRDMGLNTHVGVNVNHVGKMYARVRAFYEEQGSGDPEPVEVEYLGVTAGTWTEVHQTLNSISVVGLKTVWILEPDESYYRNEVMIHPSPEEQDANGADGAYTVSYPSWNQFTERFYVQKFIDVDWYPGGTTYLVNEVRPWLVAASSGIKMQVPWWIGGESLHTCKAPKVYQASYLSSLPALGH